ncbi:InlB B-repeat-containing protein [uncultured Anaerococcus sp.]|uniref:InlB B-repeat-containing protein n=1 Tax=uncultured Anaerococcus sp. TaxID=293428 RepID=UPI00288B7708|nr:InlB B-repeat-containing protein [uncultured Anaerococcus sp.]
MKKRIITFLLAIIMIFEIMMPVRAVAKEITPKQNNLVRVGSIDVKSYPKPNVKIIQEANRQQRNKSNGRRMKRGVQLFSSPYFPDQDPENARKPLIFGNVTAIFSTRGLDGKKFDWEGVFGTDQDGKPNKALIVFEQSDDTTSRRTGIKYFLKVDKDGKYTWSDDKGNPTKLPIYSKELKPYRYDVLLDQDVTEHVKLLTTTLFGTNGGYSFGDPDPNTGEIVGDINLDIKLQQVASTKFTSKWNTGVEVENRPTVEGSFLPGNEIDPDNYGIFRFPSNDTEKSIIRNDRPDPNDPGEYSDYRARDLDTTPKVGVADPDEESTDTYKLDRDNKRISYKNKVYKYDLTYDVINGGKLTMTEILPITFDANGGKFDSITDPTAEQKIVKEVEYDGKLKDIPEKPSKDLETFKGWAKEKNGTTLSDEEFKAEITNVTKAKTFYAIWDNNDIQEDALEVKESFKNDGDTEYMNDFIPTYDNLREQVKIKDKNGDPKSLSKNDTLAIIDGSKEYTEDSADLKAFLYEKLKEKDNPNGEPTRIEIVDAKVRFKNGKTRDVKIPIKVIKNIYEAKTRTKKPYYVPKDYVKVTVDPTTKATDPQKYYYYVNPKAMVVIPGNDPTPNEGYEFIKWHKEGDADNTKYVLGVRTQFDKATKIEAQYSQDVIPQKGDKKPDNLPDGFVKVTFVPTDKGTMEGAKIFWVKKNKDVIIPVKNPKGSQYYTFKEWKMGADANGDSYSPSTPKQFTADETTITATYTESKDIIEYDPKDPITRPEGYIRVSFDADPGLKLKDPKFYYVKKNGKKADGSPLTLKDLAKPQCTAENGYKFEKWDKDDTTEIKEEDILVTAKASDLDGIIPEKDKNGKPNTIPDGYIKVTFKPGANGSLEGETTFYVNPNKAVVLKDSAPKVKANDGYSFARWDISIDQAIQYKDGQEITALYNDIENISEKEVEGFVKVEFKEGDHGEIKGIKNYWIRPGVEVNIPSPTVIAKDDYKFKGWDNDLTVNLPKGSKTYIVTAKYEEIKKAETPECPDVKGNVLTTTPLAVDKGTSFDNYDWSKHIFPGEGKEIDSLTIKQGPDTSEGGKFTSAIIEVTFKDGTKADALVWIYVKEPCENTCPNPNPTPNPTPNPEPKPEPDPILPGDDEPGVKDPDKENPDKDKDHDKE